MIEFEILDEKIEVEDIVKSEILKCNPQIPDTGYFYYPTENDFEKLKDNGFDTKAFYAKNPKTNYREIVFCEL